MTFQNRAEAGKQLATRLLRFAQEQPIVIALPRGGLPVAAPVASALGCPLDIAIVRKVGHPLQPEFGIGAVTEDDFLSLDPRAADAQSIDPQTLETILTREAKEIQRQSHLYRGERPPIEVEGRTVILVDDGLATGVSMFAAADLMRRKGAARVIAAVPVAAMDSVMRARRNPAIDEIVTVLIPKEFYAVGEWYADFGQVSDDEVVEILLSFRREGKREGRAARTFDIVEGRISLPGNLNIPASPQGVVIFAHGSGSSRLSPRNARVARALNDAGFATYLFDLLTEEEADRRRNVFDIPLLAGRLKLAFDRVSRRPELGGLPIGFFGASTGAAAALKAAADLGNRVSAVVSRGGRPDLSSDTNHLVQAATLLIVGENDPEVLDLNEQVLTEIPHADLEIVPGATHLFEEPGALEKVCGLATDWFARNLAAGKRAPERAA